MASDRMRGGGRDAAEMKPRFIPDYELLGRDDSGGIGFEPYTAEFGDGGRVTGAKAHLSVRGGEVDAMEKDEVSREEREDREERRFDRGDAGERRAMPRRSRD